LVKPPKRKPNGVAPVKDCPNCSAIIPAQATKCPYCNHVFQVMVDESAEAVELVEIPSGVVGRKLSDLSIIELIELQESKRYKPQFIWRVVRSRGSEAIRAYAAMKGYKSGWIARQENETDNYFADRIVLPKLITA
jgi:hypothetical protein